MTSQDFRSTLEKMKTAWPSAIVARQRIAEFSGGIISPGTLANEDCRGTGPKGRFQILNKTVYSVDSVIDWLEKKALQSGKTPNPSSKKGRKRQ